MVPAAYAADYTFTDRHGNERTVKDGEFSIAIRVAVSSDLTTWYDVGTAKGRATGLDRNGKVPEGGRFRYVRLTDLTEIDKSKEYGLIPDILEGAVMTAPITRLEFAAVSVKTYKKLSGVSALPAVVNPFTTARTRRCSRLITSM